MLEMLKFGRRVVFDKQMSNKDVLDSHLNTVHESSTHKRATHERSQQQERDYIDKRKRDDDMRESEKQFYNS